GMAGSVALVLLYILIIGLASRSLDHVWELMGTDLWLVIPIVLGFGTQVGLYAYVRKGLYLRHSTRSATTLTATGTGTSTVSMVACCAHHVSDVLPLIGTSGAVIFLSRYRTPFMLGGVIINILGILFMLRMIRRAKRHYQDSRELNDETTVCPAHTTGSPLADAFAHRHRL
ncbi:MAG: hypothetical protein HY783_10565, partial [Chloroflexi bacterium]|nr:hypothetical protein [Chloroflexota bacterium]